MLNILYALHNLIYQTMVCSQTFIILNLITDGCFETGFFQNYAHIYASLGKCPAPYLSLMTNSLIAPQIYLLEGSSLTPYSLHCTSFLYIILRSLSNDSISIPVIEKYAGCLTTFAGLLIRLDICRLYIY